MSLSVDTKFVYLISHRVRNFKQKNNHLWNFSCPICGDSLKNKSKARGYVFAKGNNLFYSCHNCGASTNLANLLKHIDATLHQEYILERYKSERVSTHSSIVNSIQPVKFQTTSKKHIFEFAEYCDVLPDDHYCIQYLKSRKIPKEHYVNLLFTDKYKDFIDNLIPDHGKEIVNDARLVIPFYDRNKELIAVSGRALETSDSKLRYITVRTDDSKEKLIYGLDRLDFNKEIIVVEGPIDSLFLDNSIASGDGNLALTAQRLIQLGAVKENIILVSDNEPRNREICSLIKKGIDADYRVVIWPNNVAQKDINDMIMAGRTQNQIQSIISNRSSKGAEALLMFNFWKKV